MTSWDLCIARIVILRGLLKIWKEKTDWFTDFPFEGLLCSNSALVVFFYDLCMAFFYLAGTKCTIGEFVFYHYECLFWCRSVYGNSPRYCLGDFHLIVHRGEIWFVFFCYLNLRYCLKSSNIECFLLVLTTKIIFILWCRQLPYLYFPNICYFTFIFQSKITIIQCYANKIFDNLRILNKRGIFALKQIRHHVYRVR